MKQKVGRFIEQKGLLTKTGKYLVALSGGADSVALLIILQMLDYDVEAVHCNFHLRGDESNRDEAFCEQLCKERGIIFHRVHFDTKTYADVHHVSIEMAARELRYKYFDQLRVDGGFTDICVAHHRDDSVETILLNLVRGTGLHGLTGIAVRNGHIVRPLLCVTRVEIEDFLKENHFQFITDSSNLVNDVKRNKLRLDVVPVLKSLNPSVGESILRMAHHLAEAEKILAHVAKPFANSLKNDGFIAHEALCSAASPEYLLYQLLTPYGFSSTQIAEISAHPQPQTGIGWKSATHEWAYERGRWYLFERSADVRKSMKLPETGTYVYDDSLRISVRLQTIDNCFTIPVGKTSISLDSNKIYFPLTIRSCQHGDRFIPFGMKGSKLVSDYLTDIKKPMIEKRRQLVVVNGNGDILWLVGERPDNRYRITDKTEKALIFSIG